MAMNEICLKHSFKNFSIDATISLNDGEIVALFGDSGSGKSTILRLLAGLIGDGILPKNELAFLFQDCTLFSNFNVYENLLYANTKTLLDDLKIIFSKSKHNAYYDELLMLAGLFDKKNASLKTLSGGEKQRLALICALSKNAKYILLDEPLSALDDTNKLALIELIKKINVKFKCTIVLVSHSCFEIHALANRVYLINNGRSLKCLSKDEFYNEKIKNNELICKI